MKRFAEEFITRLNTEGQKHSRLTTCCELEIIQTFFRTSPSVLRLRPGNEVSVEALNVITPQNNPERNYTRRNYSSWQNLHFSWKRKNPRSLANEKLTVSSQQGTCAHYLVCEIFLAQIWHHGFSSNPHSTNLTSCDFLFFPLLKNLLQRKCFANVE